MSKLTHVLTGLAALAVLAGLVAAGCGGFGPTLPSPDGEVEPPPSGAEFCVLVTDSEDAPIEGAYVYIGIQQGNEVLQRLETDATGRVCLDDLAAGSYALTVGMEGFATEYRIIEVTGEAQEEEVVMDTPVEGNPTDCPVIVAEATDFNETAGTVHITGTVTNTDDSVVAVFQDGNPTLTGLDGSAGAAPRAFDHLAFLHPGTNVFRVLASNAACTVITDPINVQWTPPQGSDFYFRVTLSWDTPTSDPDLHVWSPAPDNEHSAFWNKSINAGQLDVDDTEGFGPENFTNDTLVPGRFHVAINSYDLDEETAYRVTVRVVTGGLAANSLVRTFGPHTFTTDDNETYPVQPPNWWRPFDVVVTADGNVSVVAPDNSDLPENPSGTPAQASSADHAK